MLGHIIIEAVTPSLDCGRHPIKRVVGDPVVVEADIFRDGHQMLRAVVKWRPKAGLAFVEAPMVHVGNDRWRGELVLEKNTRYVFTIEAWTDEFSSWRGDFKKKVEAGRDVRSDILEGLALLEAVGKRTPAGGDRDTVEHFVAALKSARDPRAALEAVQAPLLDELVLKYAPRAGATVYEPLLEIVSDRPRALFSTWYEMFPRSQGRAPGRASTLREAEWRLPQIRDMGFDVVYLPPIHPIGITNRKGRNNTLVAEKGDPGSPWAVGGPAGGHTSIEPSLGTVDDFDHFVTTARHLGMEIALDFAIQCSPDHPWAKEHPEWFSHRPDGSIKYAENPPKEYQDIYPNNFDTPEQEALVHELRRAVLFWVEHGVRIFRVDNPHTKPVPFWEWLIASVQAEHPDVIFLAEAFTRPKMMRALAKVGFTQSYTYFTWRNSKWELTEYLTELTQTESREFFRPNFFANTPDILPPILQTGGRPAFKMRLVLAATLSPSYGIYSGFELCEAEPLPGKHEEYLDSEKYEIKYRDYNRAGNINEYLARINAVRRENKALQQLVGLRFLDTDNDQILAYAKFTPDKSNVIIVAVNLDPHHPHHCTVTVPPDVVGVPPGHGYDVVDLVTFDRYAWGEKNFVRLDPQVEPAHVLRVERRR